MTRIGPRRGRNEQFPRASSCRASGPQFRLCGRVQRGRLFYFVITHDSPEEADELTGYRNDGDVRRLPMCDTVISLVETMLGLPAMGDHGGRLAALTLLEFDANRGSVPVVPGSLNEHVTTPRVTRLGDGALVVACSGGVLAGHEPEIGHDLTRALKASPVADLGDQGHGRQRADAAETGELLDLRTIEVAEMRPLRSDDRDRHDDRSCSP